MAQLYHTGFHACTGGKVAHLIKLAIIRHILLGNHTKDFSLVTNCCAVIQGIVQPHRKTHRKHQRKPCAALQNTCQPFLGSIEKRLLQE